MHKREIHLPELHRRALRGQPPLRDPVRYSELDAPWAAELREAARRERERRTDRALTLVCIGALALVGVWLAVTLAEVPFAEIRDALLRGVE